MKNDLRWHDIDFVVGKSCYSQVHFKRDIPHLCFLVKNLAILKTPYPSRLSLLRVININHVYRSRFNWIWRMTFADMILTYSGGQSCYIAKFMLKAVAEFHMVSQYIPKWNASRGIPCPIFIHEELIWMYLCMCMRWKGSKMTFADMILTF